MFDAFLQGFELILRIDIFVYFSGGLFLGILVGALPGFTTPMAMALLLPVSFFLDPLLGIPLLIGVYKGGVYGGGIPAILVSIPGSPASVAATFDGPALTRQGQGRKALEVGLYASVIGNLTSDIFTIALIGPIAAVALLLGPPELAAVLLLALIVVVGKPNGAFSKGLLMLALGLFLGLLGHDPIRGGSGLSLGIPLVESGVPLLPMLVGLIALPEIFVGIGRKTSHIIKAGDLKISGTALTFREFRDCFRTTVRSAVIGAGIGFLPFAGRVLAAFVGYAAATNASTVPGQFGKGRLEGVAAAEAAKNAVNGTRLTPLLTLGLPGESFAIILFGALIAQGMRPGPQLMEQQGTLVFAILFAMIPANFLLLGIGKLCMPIFARVLTHRNSFLLPLTLLFAVAGTWALRTHPTDLAVLAIFGALGYVARKCHFAIMPLAMGFILGPTLESAIGRTSVLAQGDILPFIFVERPIAALLFVAIPIVAYVFWRRRVHQLGSDSER